MEALARTLSAPSIGPGVTFVSYATIMFVPADRLTFDLASIDRHDYRRLAEIQPLGFTEPVVESCGDFIVAEMESSCLRRLEGDEASFSDEATPEEFRDCVFAALDRWLVLRATSTRRTPEEMDEYDRPCGE